MSIKNYIKNKKSYDCKKKIKNAGILLISYNTLPLKVLLVRDINNKKYMLPVGGIKNNDGPFRTSKREFFEETWLKLEPLLSNKEYIYYDIEHNNSCTRIYIYFTNKDITKYDGDKIKNKDILNKKDFYETDKIKCVELKKLYNNKFNIRYPNTIIKIVDYLNLKF